MARIRQLKPEFWRHDAVGALSRDARLTFLGLLTEADDEGRLLDSPKMLAGSLFPYDDDVTPKKLNSWLEEIIAVGLVVRYETARAHYLHVCGFNDHQKIAHPRKSSLPAPPEGTSDSRNPRETLTTEDGEPPAPDTSGSGSPREKRQSDLGVKGSRGQGNKGVAAAAKPQSALRDAGPKVNYGTPDQKAIAKAVIDDWWQAQGVPPPNEYIGVRKVLERLVASGVGSADLRRALDEAPTPTLPALQVALGRQNGSTSHNGRILTETDGPTISYIPEDWQ